MGFVTAEHIDQIIDDAYPPGSEERRRLDAAAEDAKRLLAEHGYGHLLEDDVPPRRRASWLRRFRR